MNYELAKKLQTTLPMCNPEIEPMDMRNGKWLPRNMNNEPVGLSELIEACGEDYFILQRKGTVLWFASVKEHSWSEGETREEAVANLWLALNEKSV